MPRPAKDLDKPGKKHASQQSVDSAIWSVCDIMRRGNVASAIQYVPELTWILFLRILDETEQREAQEADAVGATYAPSLKSPYRWADRAASAPKDAPPGGTNKRKDVARNNFPIREVRGRGRRPRKAPHAPPPGRSEWPSAGVFDPGHTPPTMSGCYSEPYPKQLHDAGNEAFLDFVDTDLIPHLKALRDGPQAASRQKVISEILSGVEKVRIDTEKNLLDVLDTIHEITNEAIDPRHVFTLSQVYEGLLLEMGEKGSDAGQFFTPREVIRAMVRVVDPRLGETVFDPCCGTGGFLAQAYEHMKPRAGQKVAAHAVERLKDETFWGREKENLIYPISLANLILHGIDRPNIWHGNALTGDEVYGGLFAGAPSQFDVILTNPPFGGKEGAGAQTNFDYRTSATQILFLQLVIRALKNGGRCGMVIDEGVLFRANEDAFVKTKRKLTDECDLWCIVSLPGGVFTAAGAGVKTNLLFFTKGKPTEKIWYYDLSDVKVGKKTPLELEHFADFTARLATRDDSERSWTVDLSARKAKAADDARPFQDVARAKGREAEQAKDRLGALKKAKPRDEDAISKAEAELSALVKASREAANKAESIANAVYDLKAVNPHRKAVVDARTTAELLDLIEEKGREVAAALAVLRSLNALDGDSLPR